ncbi:unnamed protein product [Effrenium voratum]|uniref:Uncharacterized protein n=1 Tax=Effrenium voratum TaxID=2562239 RepID=A0AA36HJV5_9DINO|nr:unnamed protein product [Effrenium voratum]
MRCNCVLAQPTPTALATFFRAGPVTVIKLNPLSVSLVKFAHLLQIARPQSFSLVMVAFLLLSDSLMLILAATLLILNALKDLVTLPLLPVMLVNETNPLSVRLVKFGHLLQIAYPQSIVLVMVAFLLLSNSLMPILAATVPCVSLVKFAHLLQIAYPQSIALMMTNPFLLLLPILAVTALIFNALRGNPLSVSLVMARFADKTDPLSVSLVKFAFLLLSAYPQSVALVMAAFLPPIFNSMMAVLNTLRELVSVAYLLPLLNTRLVNKSNLLSVSLAMVMRLQRLQASLGRNLSKSFLPQPRQVIDGRPAVEF